MRFVNSGQLYTTSVALLGLAAAVAFPVTNAHAQVVANGSFEVNTTSFTSFPGYVSTGANPTISSWISNNTRSGLNNESGTGNAFADNGVKPAGPTVAFLQAGDQGPTSLSQSISGFVAGNQYTVSFALNRRSSVNNGVLTLNVSLGGTSVFTSSAIATGAYTNQVTGVFTAVNTTNTLSFLATNSLGTSGDATALIDNVVLTNVGAVAGPEPGSLALLIPAGLGVIGMVRRRRK